MDSRQPESALAVRAGMEAFDTHSGAELQAFFANLRKAHRSALLLDYDGTLAPFQEDRDRAFPYPGVSMLLGEIMSAGHTRVVVISGRRAGDVVCLLAVDPHPEIWGVHGLQRLRPNGSCESPEIDEIARQALAEAAASVEQLGLGGLVEHKPCSIALHWRGLSPESQAETRNLVRQKWQPVADRGRMLLHDFDGGIELRRADRDKGDAVRDVLRELAPETPVAYLGDDLTDEDAFQALGKRGLTVLVRPEYRPTAAATWLQPPAELQEFLAEWLEACRTAQREPAHRASR